MRMRSWTRWAGVRFVVSGVVLVYANALAASTFVLLLRSGWSDRVGEVMLIGGTIASAALVLFGLYALTGRLDKQRLHRVT